MKKLFFVISLIGMVIGLGFSSCTNEKNTQVVDDEEVFAGNDTICISGEFRTSDGKVHPFADTIIRTQRTNSKREAVENDLVVAPTDYDTKDEETHHINWVDKSRLEIKNLPSTSSGVIQNIKITSSANPEVILILRDGTISFYDIKDNKSKTTSDGWTIITPTRILSRISSYDGRKENCFYINEERTCYTTNKW